MFSPVNSEKRLLLLNNKILLTLNKIISNKQDTRIECDFSECEKPSKCSLSVKTTKKFSSHRNKAIKAILFNFIIKMK